MIGDAWEALIGRDVSKAADVEFQQVGETVRRDKFLQKYGLLRYKPRHEELPTIVLEPRGETRRTVIWLDPAGKSAVLTPDGTPKPAIRKLLENGTQVVALDLFEQGEFLPDGKPLTETRQVTNKSHNSAAYTFGYNRALFAQRVHDVLTAISYFRGDDQSWGAIDVVGLNGAGHWAAAAKAMAGKAVERTVIDTGGFRFANLTAADHPDFLPGAAKYFDLPGLLALSAPGEIWLRGETSPAGSENSANADGVSLVTSTYDAAGAKDKLTFDASPPDKAEAAAVEWLLRK